MYYKLVLIYFPRSKLGINVKSYQNVVYVESTDNTWGSTTRRFLYLGDAILRIDDTEILDLPTTQNALRTGFSKNGVVTIIVERAVHQESYAFVRSVMGFSKVLDPMLPQDVIQTCTARLAYHNKHGFAEPTPIFKGYTKDYSSAGRVSVTNTVEIKSIRTEQLNPEILQNVPDFSNPENK
ncbi:PDZ domain-containing protein [Caenorhabditis elegans]|uniref:PDZ domain-containing protein n=1 Tax=Caenorhabditis elegans TaxID=6239 RepID=Q19653_CAEEL|nr:PDZ domain-containing protein [Caenorhabditis elegans]CCD68331.2 PDZ domain-containing protein [Caenorhabditis elegans]|eukprot:NP_505110.2 Uncharacterized protein CELE_F20D6.1 [Caenorhabditis elegans]